MKTNKLNKKKANFEHYICGVDQSGRPIEILVLNNPASVFSKLNQANVSVDIVVSHMCFQHEFLWRQHFKDYDEVTSYT